MLISKLHLLNFSSHADTVLDLAKLTVIRGENGSGKSSVEQAIEYLLTGRSESTDERGAGAKDLIRKGADKFVVTGTIQDDGERKIRCSLTEKSPRNRTGKKESDPEWNADEYFSYLDLNRDALSCMVNGRYFVNLSETRQKEVLASIILPTSYIWDDWVDDACSASSISINWAQKPFDVIAQGYAAAFAERTAVNRKIKDWREPEPVSAPQNTVEQIQARLKVRQDERTTLAVERNRILGVYEAAKAKSGDAGKRVERLRAKLAQETELRKDVSRFILDSDKLKSNERIAGYAPRAAELAAEIVAKQAVMALKQRQIKDILELADAPECPMCKTAITPEKLNAIAGPITSETNLLKAEINGSMLELKELGDVDGAQKAIAAHRQAERDLKLIDGKIADIEKDHSDAVATDEAAESLQAPDVAEIDAKLAEMDTRLATGSQALTAAMRVESAKASYDAAMMTKRDLDAKLVNLEKLVAYFGPKGVQAKLLNEHVGGFEQKMNRVLSKWGFEAQLNFDPYSLTLHQLAGKGYGLNLRTISTSQRYRFGVAFQVALAITTGFKIVIVDGADILDQSSRKPLYEALLSSGLDQAIVTATDANRAIPGVADSAFYMLTLDKSGDVPTTVVERLK